jgi:predicted ferric reductase
MRAKLLIQGSFWLGLYVLLALAPLFLIFFVGDKPPGRSFWTELSVALGYVGLAMMTLQFALTARFEFIKAPYGSDVVYSFHKQISLVSVAFILLHPFILLLQRGMGLVERAWTAPWPFWTGTTAVVCLVLLCVVSIWRKQLKLEYDTWRRLHAVFAMVAVTMGVVHILFISHYTDTPLKRGLWLGYTGLFALLIVYVRLLKPWLESQRPWEVAAVIPQPGNAVTLRLKPLNHAGLKFSPGQFAWITVNDSPFTDHEHPFSFSGSAHQPDHLEFTIKELGDWTQQLRHTPVGTRAFVDGPFGALTMDRHPDKPGFVFIAGGIGITPMISHLRTMRDRGDTRPAILFYGAKSPADFTLKTELDQLARDMPNVKIVYVASSPSPDWTGETGYISKDILAKYLPENGGNYECFICGPQVMMDAVETALNQLGVPLGDFHSERFNLV